MKNIIALILCFIMLFSTQALAVCEGEKNVNQPAFISVVIDFLERFKSMFTGSTNEKSDIEFTCEKGQLFEKN